MKTATALETAIEHYLVHPADIFAHCASLTQRIHAEKHGERWETVYDAVS